MMVERNLIKERALELLDNTIKEMQQSLTQKDVNDVFWCDLGAEINLMDDFYKKLCQLFKCKEYGLDIKGFVCDLQNKTLLQSLKVDDYSASFLIKHRRWQLCIINNDYPQFSPIA